MIVDLNEKIKDKRQKKSLLLKDIQDLSNKYYGDKETLHQDYIQKVESGKFSNLELWTLYKLSSILECDIFFSDSENNIKINVDGDMYIVKYSSLLSIDPEYTQNHHDSNYKKQFLTLLGVFIKNNRESFNLTQVEFSDCCSISRATLQRLELGLTSAKLNTVINVLFRIYKLNEKRNQ